MESHENGQAEEVVEVAEVVLRDLTSQFADVSCPIHNQPPRFDVDEAGGVVEHICCEVLLNIVRELQAQEPAAGEAGVSEEE
jgi:hypothetical protein